VATIPLEISLLSKFKSSSQGEGKEGYLPEIGNKIGHTSNPKTPLDSLSDEDFFEWLRGFVDAEGDFFYTNR
jgi:hypothetical protein